MIIFLNGSINSGKSTVAKLLAKAIPNMAIVEIDVLREMIEWMPIDQAVPINLENAVAVIRNFTKHGISCIVPYPLSQKNYEFVTSVLSNLCVPMFFFALAPSFGTIIDNSKQTPEETAEVILKEIVV